MNIDDLVRYVDSNAYASVTTVKLRFSDGSTLTVTAQVGALTGRLKLDNDVLTNELHTSPHPIVIGKQHMALQMRGEVQQIVTRGPRKRGTT